MEFKVKEAPPAVRGDTSKGGNESNYFGKWRDFQRSDVHERRRHNPRKY